MSDLNVRLERNRSELKSELDALTARLRRVGNLIGEDATETVAISLQYTADTVESVSRVVAQELGQ